MRARRVGFQTLVATRPHLGTGAVLLLVCLAAVAPLRSHLLAPVGFTQEEPLLLVAGPMSVRGSIPWRDFSSFFGPAAYWVPGAVFEATSVSFTVERLVGFAYHLLLVGGVVSVTRPAGVGASLAAALVTILAVPFIFAHPWSAAMGLLMLAIALASQGTRRRSRFAAGVLVAGAALFRPETLVVGIAVLLAACTGRGRSVRRDVAVGLVLGSLPLVTVSLLAGAPTMVSHVSDMLHLGAERRLPVDGLSPVLQLWLLASAVGTVLLLVAGIHGAVSRHRHGPLVLALGLLSLGGLPELLQRVDRTHLGFAGYLPIALLPVATLVLPLGSRGRTAVTVVIVLFFAGVLAPETTRPYLRHASISAGFNDRPRVEVFNQGRSAPVTPGVAGPLTEAIEAAAGAGRPGDRLFVGPEDLTRTTMTNNLPHHLLPGFEPNHFLDLFPGVALRHGDALAADLEASDVVILDREVSRWTEPNRSRVRGSAAAVTVLDERFCEIARSEQFIVYDRCH